MTRAAKWTAAGIAVVIMGILAVSLGFLVHQAIYSGKVSVLVAPSTATVAVGNYNFETLGEYDVEPGEYVVEITAEGFKPRTGHLKVVAGDTAKVSAYLLPLAENAGWYDEHPDDALVMGEIINAERLAQVQEVLEAAPILQELPATFEYYTEGMAEYVKYVVTYEFDDSEVKYHLVVKDYTGGNLDAALEWILEHGGVTEGVVYEDLTNDKL